MSQQCFHPNCQNTFRVAAAAVPEEEGRYPGSDEPLSHGRAIGVAAGLLRLGVHLERVEPGQRTSFPHAHEDEEEFVYVIAGEIDAWVDGTLHTMRAGELAAFPAGTGIAHTFLNNGNAEALLLVGGERSRKESRLFYPANPERRETMRPGRWWSDAPRRLLGVVPPHPRAPGEAWPPVLETERLVLRWWQKGDEAALVRILGDPRVAASGLAPLAGSADAAAWLEGELVEAPARGYGQWAMVERESGEVVGVSGFGAGAAPDELVLGCTVAPACWRRGYASELGPPLLSLALSSMRARRVVAYVDPGNAPARRVVERIGMRHLGDESREGASWSVYEILA